MRTRYLASLIASLLVLGAADASARGVRIDVGSTFNTSTGNLWDPLVYLDLTNDPVSGAIDLGFSIDFGAGLVNSLFVHEDGSITFGSPAGATDIATPYGFDIQSVAADQTQDLTQFQNQTISYSTGITDTDANAAGEYEESEAVDSFRVTWNGMDLVNGQFGTFQVVFIDRSGATGAAGDFDLEFNYSFGTLPAPPDAGFSLGAGTNVFTLADFSEFSDAVDYTFAFRGGILQGTTPPPPTTVPEPGSLSLLAAGLLFLALGWRRRLAVAVS